MADIEYDSYDPAYGEAEQFAPRPGLFKVVNWMGGVTSLALIAGLGYWGYNLMMRDVTGVPVVRALEGPIRVTPEDPGGVLAEYQGLSVNEVAGSGIAGELSDTITLAPDAMALLDEDLPVADLAGVAARDAGAALLSDTATFNADAYADANSVAGLAPVAVDDLPDDALATDVAVAEALAGAGDDPAARALALADAIADGVAPLSGAGEAPELARVSEVEAPAAARALEGGIARSPRPQGRPADLAPPAQVALADDAVAVDEVQALSSGPRVTEVDVADIPAGTRLVQLGAFESAEIARSQWGSISEKFEEYFEGKSRVVQKAESGGKTFYRLRALGFADLSDARRFCTALLSGQADCIPVVVK